MTPAPAVEKKKIIKPAPPADPLKQVERKAQKCRKAHGALDGPKIVVDYAVGLDGKVTRSVPSVHDALGKCLAEAVLSTPFEPSWRSAARSRCDEMAARACSGKHAFSDMTSRTCSE
ncbi:hypothetical protein [Nannocystis pusilla]|uniref:hypothetical protein n=1 Tax=Nannocystis pusilla TaxID=889268 RepID=UPI003B7A38D1